jgi:DNA-directed RNA polymerase specialized sigma24 family protein
MKTQSKYITRYTEASNPKYGTFTRRQILLTLPRVQWLDRQLDYEPWPEIVIPEPPAKEEKPKPKPRPCIKLTDELTEREAKAWALHCKGLIVLKIAEAMGCSPNAASKALARAKEKQGIGLE